MKEKIEKNKRRGIMKKQKLRKNKGITLIALVITIIVLLILAGVSIAMLTGQNGILTQAQKAKSETENAAKNEAAILDEYNKYLNNAVGGGIVEGGTKPETDDQGYFTKNSTINGEKGNADNPTIPAGFKPIDENEANWGDGSKVPEQASVENGLVIQDKEGNQFVWVPVRGEYKRNTTYAETGVSAAAYTDTGYLPEGMETGNSTNNENAEREAVTNKGGFYISRYEAGKETVNSTNKLVSKSGATVWNNIAVEDDGETKGCKTVAKKFVNNNNVKSALCSGIQWDMTMAFVNGKKDGVGNTIDVTINEDRGGSSPASSGQHPADRMCNIFDLEGNYLEYVAERNSYSDRNQFVYRGGSYYSSTSASYRLSSFGTAYSYYSFRFTLYVM